MLLLTLALYVYGRPKGMLRPISHESFKNFTKYIKILLAMSAVDLRIVEKKTF